MNPIRDEIAKLEYSFSPWQHSQAMQQEIDALRQRNAELEELAEGRLEQMQSDRKQALVWRDRVKELEDACDKFSEAEILLKDFDVRGHPA